MILEAFVFKLALPTWKTGFSAAHRLDMLIHLPLVGCLFICLFSTVLRSKRLWLTMANSY